MVPVFRGDVVKILVTGANGQLGKDVIRILEAEHEVFGFSRKEMDIRDLDCCLEVMDRFRPDAVIHCAAYTAVDQAESEPDEAFRVNAFGSRNIALAAERVGSKICYISTDYVFDGMSDVPYNEYDNTNPASVYGKSKRAGEQLVQSLSSKYFIVRTSWVYGRNGNNFVKTMLRLAKERDKLKVVHDQVGSPTYTVDLSRFLSDLIVTDKYGIYHASNTGRCSWYEFACAIFEESGISVQVDPCTTEEFPRPAPRPKFSVLDHMSIRANGFSDLRHWREALKEFLQELKQEE